MFKLIKKSTKSQARLGVLNTAHGKIDTPFFMPIATKAAIKTLTAAEVKELGAQIILSNTYHNYLQPGIEIIKKFGGLHNFMQTDLPILTDSGGYQVFSLSNLRKIKGDDIEFSSHLDGSKHILNPKKVIDIQVALGSDIIMVLDECVGLPSSVKDITQALERTTRWAGQALAYKKKLNAKSAKIKKQLLFAIVQGGDNKKLRLCSVQELLALERAVKLTWDGLAIGGLAVGETNKTMYEVLDYTLPMLPANKPRYLMGVGYPENIIEAVKRGVDMFDCVIPTREARHGRLYVLKNKYPTVITRSKATKQSTSYGLPRFARNDWYEVINITNSKFKADKTPINNTNLKNYSRAYLHHLFKTQESLGLRLATLNNLEFYLTLMADIRLAIQNKKL
jgi:queuine tRNA-ribosyltransferase